jgi:MFS family permease
MTRDDRRRAGLLLVATLTVMSTGFISPSMPQMAEHFRDAPHAELLTKLILTMPALVIALFAPIAGLIVDRFGRRRFLHLAMLLYGATGAAGYWLSDLNHMLVSRALLGLAIGATMTIITTLAGDYFQGEARSRFTGSQSIVMSMGAVVAVGIGGILADVDWRLPFLIYGAAWLFLVPVAAWVDEPGRTAHAVAAPESGGGARAPLGPLALVYATTFFAVAMFYMTAVQVPFLVRSIGIESNALSGFAIALSSVSSAISSSRYYRLKRRLGYVRIYAFSFGAMAVGYGMVALTDSYAVILAGLFVAGLGVGLFFPNGTLWAVTLAPPAIRGRVSGGLTASVFLGQFFSPILMQPAVAFAGIAGAFGIAAGLLAAVSVAFALAPEPASARRVPA